jgi:hypothetical protein
MVAACQRGGRRRDAEVNRVSREYASRPACRFSSRPTVGVLIAANQDRRPLVANDDLVGAHRAASVGLGRRRCRRLSCRTRRCSRTAAGGANVPRVDLHSAAGRLVRTLQSAAAAERQGVRPLTMNAVRSTCEPDRTQSGRIPVLLLLSRGRETTCARAARRRRGEVLAGTEAGAGAKSWLECASSGCRPPTTRGQQR